MILAYLHEVLPLRPSSTMDAAGTATCVSGLMVARRPDAWTSGSSHQHLDEAVGELADTADDALAPVDRGSRGGQFHAVTDLPHHSASGHSARGPTGGYVAQPGPAGEPHGLTLLLQVPANPEDPVSPGAGGTAGGAPFRRAQHALRPGRTFQRTIIVRSRGSVRERACSAQRCSASAATRTNAQSQTSGRRLQHQRGRTTPRHAASRTARPPNTLGRVVHGRRRPGLPPSNPTTRQDTHGSLTQRPGEHALTPR